MQSEGDNRDNRDDHHHSSLDLGTLNEAQRQAVLTTEGPLLVLAGAGSGKTRVLTWRIARLIADCGVEPWQILAITFTNKAAGEMRARIAGMLGAAASGMWVFTYHAACVRILRASPDGAELLGYRRNFTIYDDDDAKRLVKDIMRELDIDPKTFPLATIRHRISQAKNELLRPDDLDAAGFGSAPIDRYATAVYARYEDRLRANNAMDFDDLLLNVVRLFQEFPKVLARYQQRFRYIHVDEYQDTNRAQYLITKLLATGHRNLMVVGDDDQSIYSWRGADITNILEFEADYPEACVVKLEQNYRSTGTILDAANAVVTHNARRKDKHLYPADGTGRGAPIELYLATNEHDEARWIAAEIESISREEGRALADFAIFYRTNAQSRVLEDALLRAGLPYRIVGGTRYFDRAEIRDLMAYLKVIVNPDDEISLRRIINTPRRGLGSTSIDAITSLAAREGLSFEAALRRAATVSASPPGVTTPLSSSGLTRGSSPAIPATLKRVAQKSAAAFVAALDEMRSYSGELPKVVEHIIAKSGLLTALEAQQSEEAETRAENIREFVNVAAEFADTHEEHTLFDYMEWLVLRTDLDALSGESDTVTLMTVHTAKGLEYAVVFVAGMEESLFPHANSIYDAQGLEEERRLAYVAITRARERLLLTRAASRMNFGSPQTNPPSRFIGEIPNDLIRTSNTGSRGFSGVGGWEKRGDRHGISGHGVAADADWAPSFGGGYGGSGGVVSGGRVKKPKVMFNVGDTVSHKLWGKGTVTVANGDSLEVDFPDSVGHKKLIASLAPLVKIN